MHLAIAEAANNPRFVEFLRLAGASVIPRRAVSDGSDAQISPDYSLRLIAEQGIVSAIQNGDEEGARLAMRGHLRNSQARYRQYLREAAARSRPQARHDDGQRSMSACRTGIKTRKLGKGIPPAQPLIWPHSAFT